MVYPLVFTPWSLVERGIDELGREGLLLVSTNAPNSRLITGYVVQEINLCL